VSLADLVPALEPMPRTHEALPHVLKRTDVNLDSLARHHLAGGAYPHHLLGCAEAVGPLRALKLPLIAPATFVEVSQVRENLAQTIGQGLCSEWWAVLGSNQ
jgi:hypothetical protein